MSAAPLFQMIDAVTIPVPDLDAGLRFYRDSLGHQLRWRHDDVGPPGLTLPGGDTEIVLTTGTGMSRTGWWPLRITQPPLSGPPAGG